jgi:hypothetical protein
MVEGARDVVVQRGVANARGSEMRECYRTATVRETVLAPMLHNHEAYAETRSECLNRGSAWIALPVFF